MFLIILYWRQEQRRRNVETRVSEKEDRALCWTRMPWLQQKGELDAEKQVRNELEAAKVQRELEAEAMYELPVEERSRELKGCECAQELDVRKI